jgi:protein-tyrosine phosphatase
MFGRAEKKVKWQAIDIHCHVLPGLDDGARDMAEALSMLRIAAGEGISRMIVTPHYCAGRFTASPEQTLEKLRQVQEAADAQSIPVRLYPGSEIYWFDDVISLLKQSKLFTLGGSNYVLIEFSPSVLFGTLHNAMDRTMSEGYRPILAHAERYACLLKDIESTCYLHDMGVGIQINASTVTGKNGAEAKRFAFRLLKDNIVDYIGTDAHGATHRTPEIAKCRETILKKYGDAYAYQIMRGNAISLLKNTRRENGEIGIDA